MLLLLTSDRVRGGRAGVLATFGAFGDAAKACYEPRRSLSATGFYNTPGLDLDPTGGAGNSFHYFPDGAAVSEVMVATLTVGYRIRRADILHEAANGLNPSVDIGQVEGG